MSLKKFELVQKYAVLQAQHLDRHHRVIDQGVTPVVTINGQQYLNFSSNDYLGLAHHPAVKQAAQDYLKQHGVGAGAAHLVTGHHAIHEQLEQRLAQLSGYPAAMLFSTGYMANLGVIDALMDDRAGIVYQDRLNHASLLDGARLAGVKLRRYPHLDMGTLAQWLGQDDARQKLIVTDQIFSMDGTEAPLAELIKIAERHQAGLMIDDAHGFGLHDFSTQSQPLPQVDVYMATLGKAIGTYGAFVAGSQQLIDYLRSRARTFIFTTATPPLVAAATLAALDVIEQESWRREKLKQHIHTLRSALQQQGWQLMNSQSAIQPIIIGKAKEALMLSEKLLEQGLLVSAIRPPTVPQGTSRLRITLSAAHSDSHIEQLITTLDKL
ncbi:8-amino-7-oxononanoate synthase [Alkanindiges sp. WGS2144]|uniref:8-amino-7-oxononanoate synthase n=1 Tax=Alkanindiges sp. WGS2144 TaxID=3366808 RepID=UPI0037524FB7